MNDPKRWLEDEAATDLERDLLGAGTRLSAPRGMEARVWRGVGAKLSATAAIGAVAASTTKAAASGAGAGSGAGGAVVGGAAAGGLKASAAGAIAFKTKLVIAALVVAGASTGGALVATRMPASPSTPAQNMQSAPISTTAAAAPTVRERAPEHAPAPPEVATPVETAPVATAPEHAAPRVAKPSPGRAAPTQETKTTGETATPAVHDEVEQPKPEAASRLREDARALQEARAALAAGDPNAAEQRLAASSPTTMLAPERDALRVRIAAARGDHARASALASAFLRSYPKSPLAPQMTKFVSGATNE